VSASEWYLIEPTPDSRQDATEDVPLEYVLAEKRYEHLHHNAIKAAVIHVCMLWRLLLSCKSTRDDAADHEYHPVAPLGLFEAAIFQAIARAELEEPTA
jgi:hypothetical protein